MKIEKLLEELTDEELTLDRAKLLILNELPVDLEDLDDLKEGTIKSSSNEYKCFKNYDYAVIKYEDYKNYTYDLANELAQKLPDKFDVYFNTDELAEDMLDEFVLVKQTQNFLDNLGETVELISDIHNADDNCYILELG